MAEYLCRLMERPQTYCLAVFASGTGSNFENICRYFSSNENVDVALLVSNKARCGAMDIAQSYQIDAITIDKEFNTEKGHVVEVLKEHKIHTIVLAGFLKKIPRSIVQAFNDRILNVHPSLLPKFGGKGMYGKYVHEAVLAAKEKETGISIHLVNEVYDKGRILFQAKVDLDEKDTAADIEQKVRQLEQTYFPQIILKFLKDEL